VTTESGRPHPPDNDLALEAELRAAAGLFDPVPQWLEQAAVDSFDLRLLDSELAELVFDSSLEPAVVRGDLEPRLLTFQTGDVVVEIELSGSESARRLIGHVLPAGPTRVELRSPHDVVAVDVDELGRFATQLSAGPFSLVCRWPQHMASQVVVTDWVHPR
jgi:hypothetical protein